MDLIIVALLFAGGVLVILVYMHAIRSSANVVAAPLTIIRNSDTKGGQQKDHGLDPGTRFVDAPVRRKLRLLNDSEQELYHRLCEAMPSMTVFAQVGIAQLALLRGRTEAKRLSTMIGRGVDFVVCGDDFSIVAAIELSWPALESRAASAEEEKRQSLQSLGIPLIVFRPNELPNADVISQAIAEAIIRRNRFESERQ